MAKVCLEMHKIQKRRFLGQPLPLSTIVVNDYVKSFVSKFCLDVAITNNVM